MRAHPIVVAVAAVVFFSCAPSSPPHSPPPSPPPVAAAAPVAPKAAAHPTSETEPEPPQERLSGLIGTSPVGALDPRAVDPPLAKTASEVLAARRSELVRCYAPIIKEGGTLQGKVVLQLDVNRTGGVRSVKKLPATTIEDAGLVSCVMATIKGWSFPKNTAVLEVPLQIRQVIK